MWYQLSVSFHLGRGQHSHAYTHSVQLFHHVFLNLSSLEFYCLPDNYQIIDPSLEDIKAKLLTYNIIIHLKLLMLPYPVHILHVHVVCVHDTLLYM